MTNRHCYQWSVTFYGESNRMMKGQLEQLGEEADGLESISKVQTQILNLTKGQVNIFDDTGNFKSTYEILKDISEIYETLGSTEQAQLLEIVAGKQRGNQIAAIIQAFQSGKIESAFKDAASSAGSAITEQERWLKSLDAKLAQTDALIQSISNNLINSDMLKFLIDNLNVVLELLNLITPLLGELTSLPGLIGIGGTLLNNHLGWLNIYN